MGSFDDWFGRISLILKSDHYLLFLFFMKNLRLLIVALFAAMVSVPVMAQGTSLSTPDMSGAKERVSNFEKECWAAGPYVKFQSVEAAFLKLVSASTLGGYTLRCEKVTNTATGKSATAIKITPNTNTGFGKIVSGATGIGRNAETFYVDADEIQAVLDHVAKMQTACETEPAINTTYTYITRGGFSFSLGYVVNAKKTTKLGQIGQTGEIPFVDFTSAIVDAFTAAKEKMSMLK